MYKVRGKYYPDCKIMGSAFFYVGDTLWSGGKLVLLSFSPPVFWWHCEGKEHCRAQVLAQVIMVGGKVFTGKPSARKLHLCSPRMMKSLSLRHGLDCVVHGKLNSNSVKFLGLGILLNRTSLGSFHITIFWLFSHMFISGCSFLVISRGLFSSSFFFSFFQEASSITAS